MYLKWWPCKLYSCHLWCKPWHLIYRWKCLFSPFYKTYSTRDICRLNKGEMFLSNRDCHFFSAGNLKLSRLSHNRDIVLFDLTNRSNRSIRATVVMPIQFSSINHVLHKTPSPLLINSLFDCTRFDIPAFWSNLSL